MCGWKKLSESGVQGLVMHVKLARWGAGIYDTAKRPLFYTSTRQDEIRVRRPRAWIPCIHSMVAHQVPYAPCCLVSCAEWEMLWSGS